MQQMLVEREVSIAVRTGTSTSTYSCLLVEAVVAKRHAENSAYHTLLLLSKEQRENLCEVVADDVVRPISTKGQL